jgi:hypothetical protein
MAYVIGTATTEAAWLTTVDRSGRSEQECIDQLRSALTEATKPYPRLHTLATSENDGAEKARGDGFHYGLDRMLDGLATRLARR